MPAVETVVLPLVALPVEKPPPVQLVAFVELHVRVEGTELVGLALKVQIGAGATLAETVMAVQAPQLLPSFDSVIVPELPAEDLSAQART